VDIRFAPEDEAFRREVAEWLAENLTGELAVLRGRGGPGDEHAFVAERRAWERRLGEAGWIGIGWPREHGGRDLPLIQQVIFHEEYVRAGGPGRLGHIGEGLLGPTLIAFGTEAQRRRFLPPILRGEEIWCQGYSEPNAGSDLANVQTRAELLPRSDGHSGRRQGPEASGGSGQPDADDGQREDGQRDDGQGDDGQGDDGQGDEWVIHGQKVWTSWAEWADWCFVLCRTDPEASPKHRGISYLLVPMRQDGISVRPIVQITGDSEFSEVFFDGARTPAENVVGPVNGGWKVAMGTLAFERGASTLGQQMQFTRELEAIAAAARANGRAADPGIRQRLARAWMGLRIQRYHALRVLSGADAPELSREAMITKLFWATWHRELGELAMDVLGPEAEVAEGPPDGRFEPTRLQRLFLFSRADTIYAGSNEIQRNILAQRGLGLPREPRT